MARAAQASAERGGDRLGDRDAVGQGADGSSANGLPHRLNSGCPGGCGMSSWMAAAVNSALSSQ